MSSALSSDHAPAPAPASANRPAARARLNSYPWFALKNPLRRCTVRMAVAITAVSAAAAGVVTSPRAIKRPPNVSVTAATQAWALAGRKPICSRTPAKPLMPGPSNAPTSFCSP